MPRASAWVPNLTNFLNSPVVRSYTEIPELTPFTPWEDVNLIQRVVHGNVGGRTSTVESSP